MTVVENRKNFWLSPHYQCDRSLYSGKSMQPPNYFCSEYGCRRIISVAIINPSEYYKIIKHLLNIAFYWYLVVVSLLDISH